MIQHRYRLSVRFAPTALQPRRRRIRSAALAPVSGVLSREAKLPYDTALRGAIIAVPIAILMWAAILWCVTRLI
jgi:hypothetical protein